MRVLEGAFRFTTDALMKGRRREVNITVATVTAGIRGTDLWGKSTAEKDLICLIDGHIQVAHGGQTVDMAQPMTFFAAPKGGPAQAVSPVAPEQLAQWARETEIGAGNGASRQGGRWKLLAGHAASEEEALASYDKLRAGGFDARIKPLAGEKDGSWSYDLLLKGFASEAEAKAASARLKALTGVEASARR